MNIPINVTAEFLAEAIEEYCITSICPSGCPFDKIGVCTQENPFNTLKERIAGVKR